MSRWTRRILLAAASGLVALYLVYVVGANWYLRSGKLQGAVSHQPEHFLLRYESAWTAWPGTVRVRGLELRGQARTVQWWLHLDAATVGLDPLRLLRKDLEVGGLSASGAAFRLRRRPQGGEPTMTEAALAAAGLPAIAGLADTPAPPRMPETPGAGRDAWRLHLGDVEVDGVREIWVAGYRFAGAARVTGGFDLQGDHRLVLDPGMVAFQAGSLAMGGRPLLDSFKGTTNLSFPTFDPEKEGGGFLRLASGGLRLHGEIAGLQFLAPYLDKVRWIRLLGSPGTVDADVRVARGSYAAGTRVAVRPGRVTAWFLDDEAWGDALVTWIVSPDGSSPIGRLVVAFDEFQLGRKGSTRARGHGRGLRIEVDARALEVTELPAPVALAFDLPPAEIGDFSSYNVYLPKGGGVLLRGGRGQVSANLRATAPRWEGTGEVTVLGRGVVADVQGSRLRGNLDVHSRYRAMARERQIAMEQSDVRIYDVVSVAGPGAATTPGDSWWAKAHMDYAAVRPGAAVQLQARVRGQVSDLRPLLSLFAPSRRRLIGWLDRVLELRPVDARGEFAMGSGSFSLDGLDVTAGKAEVRARLRFAGTRRNGVLLASYGKLNVGMELHDGQRSWKLLGARGWFESQVGGGAARQATAPGASAAPATAERR